MRLSWLYAAGELVHRPSSGALGRRRTNRPPQPGAAVRLPPSGGPSSRVGRDSRRGRSPRVRAPALDRSGSDPATQHSASISPRPMTGRCTMPRFCRSTPRHRHQRERTVRRIAMRTRFGVERVFNGYCVVTHCSWPANFESIRSRRSRTARGASAAVRPSGITLRGVDMASKRKGSSWIALFAAVGLLMAACGGDDDEARPNRPARTAGRATRAASGCSSPTPRRRTAGRTTTAGLHARRSRQPAVDGDDFTIVNAEGDAAHAAVAGRAGDRRRRQRDRAHRASTPAPAPRSSTRPRRRASRSSSTTGSTPAAPAATRT